MIDEYTFSNWGHKCTPNGRSIVGAGKVIDLNVSKDMMRIVCAGAPEFSIAAEKSYEKSFESCLKLCVCGRRIQFVGKDGVDLLDDF